MFGLFKKKKPAFEVYHCPLCRTPIVAGNGKIPASFWCSAADRIVKVNDPSNEKPVEQISGKEILAKQDAP